MTSLNVLLLKLRRFLAGFFSGSNKIDKEERGENYQCDNFHGHPSYNSIGSVSTVLWTITERVLITRCSVLSILLFVSANFSLGIEGKGNYYGILLT